MNPFFFFWNITLLHACSATVRWLRRWVHSWERLPCVRYPGSSTCKFTSRNSTCHRLHDELGTRSRYLPHILKNLGRSGQKRPIFISKTYIIVLKSFESRNWFFQGPYLGGIWVLPLSHEGWRKPTGPFGSTTMGAAESALQPGQGGARTAASSTMQGSKFSRAPASRARRCSWEDGASIGSHFRSVCACCC